MGGVVSDRMPNFGTGWSDLWPITDGGASVATGTKIFAEVGPAEEGSY